MTAPIYSAMEQPSEWVYYFQIIQRRMLWEEKMYPASRLIHLRVHHQMSSRSCKIYNWNSTRKSAIQIQCKLSWIVEWSNLRLKQYQEKCHSDPMQTKLNGRIWPVDLVEFDHYLKHLTTGPLSTTNTLIQNMTQPVTSFRTTTPSNATTGRKTKQVDPVHQDTPRKAPLGHCMHVHQPPVQVCKPGESLTLRKVKHPHNGRTSVNRLPLTKQDILSQYSSCFEGIGHFSGDPYKFHLKPEYQPACHAPRKVPIHLESAFKEEIESLVKLGILE